MHKCSVCGFENWHDLDYLRNQQYWFDRNIIYDEKIGFKICKECGFITYTPRWTKEQLKEKYSKERLNFSTQLILNAIDKNEIHRKMLGKEIIESIKTMADLGCGIGHTRKLFPTAKIYGTEYANGLSNYAKRVNTINIIDDVSKIQEKLDLIIMFHSIEHVYDLDGLMSEIKRILKPDGYFYIGLPLFLGNLHEVSTKPCQDFEEHYHLNHQNIFTEKTFNYFMAKHGFKQIKVEDRRYGHIVLFQNGFQSDDKFEKEDYIKLEEQLKLEKKILDIFQEGIKLPLPNQPMKDMINLGETLRGLYPRFVDAYLLLASQKQYASDFGKLVKLYKTAIENCGHLLQIDLSFAKMFFNWGEPGKDMNNGIKLSSELIEQVLEYAPNQKDTLFMKMNRLLIYENKGQEAAEVRDIILSIYPNFWDEIQTKWGWYYCQNEIKKT